MSEVLKQIVNVFLHPSITIKATMEKKNWLIPMILLLILSSTLSYFTFPVMKVEQAKLLRESPLADRLSEEQLANMENYTSFQRFSSLFWSGLTLVITLLLGTAFLYLFYKIPGCEGMFANYFSAFTVASFIDLGLGGLVKSFIILTKHDILASTSLTLLFPHMNIRSFTYVLLSQIDFFPIWFLIALALGIAAYAKISTRKSLTIAFSYFLFKILVISSFSYMTMKLFKLT